VLAVQLEAHHDMGTWRQLFASHDARPEVAGVVLEHRRFGATVNSSLDNGASGPAGYSRTAISLHWLVAGLIVCAFALGWVMTELAISPLRVKMFNWHKWVGMTILALAAIRAIWRLTHPAPPLLPMPAWQRVSAHALHGLLYVLMFALPLSGWAYSNATGYPIVYLGLMRLPNLVERNKQLASQLEGLHVALGWLLLGVVVVHVLAALKHHFFDRDDTLNRMLRWRS
jgi:cytochrome b561